MSGKAKIRVQAQIIDELREELRKASHPRIPGCRLHPTANHYDYAGLIRCAECECLHCGVCREKRKLLATAERQEP